MMMMNNSSRVGLASLHRLTRFGNVPLGAVLFIYKKECIKDASPHVRLWITYPDEGMRLICEVGFRMPEPNI
jgi:hypothetical protein